MKNYNFSRGSESSSEGQLISSEGKGTNSKGQMKAFSFVEIIITISIVILLAVIGFNISSTNDDNVKNAKVSSDTTTLEVSLLAYWDENKTLPLFY